MSDIQTGIRYTIQRQGFSYDEEEREWTTCYHEGNLIDTPDREWIAAMMEFLSKTERKSYRFRILKIETSVIGMDTIREAIIADLVKSAYGDQSKPH
jgi:hypothetical protein